MAQEKLNSSLINQPTCGFTEYLCILSPLSSSLQLTKMVVVPWNILCSKLMRVHLHHKEIQNWLAATCFVKLTLSNVSAWWTEDLGSANCMFTFNMTIFWICRHENISILGGHNYSFVRYITKFINNDMSS